LWVNGKYHHQWYLGSDNAKDIDKDRVAKALDEHLKRMNKNYRVARGKALHGINVELIPSELFHAWSERNKKMGGQVKTARMMSEEGIKEFGEFTKSEMATT